MLASDFVLGIGNRWANRHTGSIDVYTKGRKFVHVDIEPTQIGRVFGPDLGIVSDAKAALELFVEVAREWKAAGRLKDRSAWVERMPRAQEDDAARDALRRGADQAAARLRGDEQGLRQRHLLRQRPSACRRSPPRSSCTSTSRATGSTAARPARSAGRFRRRSACARPIPTREIVALSGDYDFQFMIEELAVGAQFKLPYIHVVVNNSYLGLIRQSQRGFEMDYCVQLSFENINAPELGGYGVDHVEVAEGLGCKAIRVTEPEEIADALEQAQALMEEFRVPVVVEIILERVTNIAMGTEIDNVIEFEDLAKDADATRRPRSRCSTESRRHAQGDRRAMPKFAANLTMLFNEVDVSRPLRARPRRPAFDGVEYLFPYAVSQGGAGRALARHGLTQVLHNLPAGDWAEGERGIACLPDRVGEFRDGVGRAIDYAKALGCRQVNCLVGIAPKGVDARRGARDARRQSALRRARTGERRHQAADRADQHLRHSRLLPEPHAARRWR